MRARSRALAAVLSMVASACSLCACRSDIRSYVIHQDVKELDNYLSPPKYRGVDVARVSPRVYTVRVAHQRTLFVVDDDGVIVFDPLSTEATHHLSAAIQKVAPGRPIKTLVYTHYHLDRASGGASLSPRDVIAHEGCRARWQELGATAATVVQPTTWLTGDTELQAKGVSVRLLHLPRAHTETLFAVHLPAERVLFTADLGWVRALPPFGYPDAYAPGVEAALARLAQLDFDVFVPGSFEVGTKRDLLDWQAMFLRGRTLARAALAPHGGRFPVEREPLLRAFDTVYQPLRAEYGEWHGFTDMSGYFVLRLLEGEASGH
ncbi:putative polyketide cyclase [Minicystis rosea]|nr:putative polyketide cyclase [Minicystis rosea]